MTNEGATYQRPWLYDKQRDAIFCDERYGIVEASTKSGKTVGCIIWLTEQAMMGKSGQNFWWVAPIFGQAKIAFRRLIRSLPRHVYKINYSEMTVTLANGAIIWFKGADNGDSLYGEDVHAAVIDEATRCKVESWYAVRSTLTATKGPIRIIGNVKGRKNWAYRIARRAQAGAPDMH
jgi:phage terminase large subunit-like protein